MDCCADEFLSHGMYKFYFSKNTQQQKHSDYYQNKKKIARFSDKKTKTYDFK